MFVICYSFKIRGRKREELKDKHRKEKYTFKDEVNLNTSCFGLMTYDLVKTKHTHVSVVLKQPEIKRSKSKVEIQSL